jgi:hypothetical protein
MIQNWLNHEMVMAAFFKEVGQKNCTDSFYQMSKKNLALESRHHKKYWYRFNL